MAAREGVMHSSVYGDKLKMLYPVVEAGMSDSGCVDNVLEFLCMAGGRELPEVNCQKNALYFGFRQDNVLVCVCVCPSQV